MRSVIAGRAIPKYAISLGTYGSIGALAYSMSGGKKAKGGAKHDAAPSFQSSSRFVQGLDCVDVEL